MTIVEAAEKWGLSSKTVSEYVRSGRIPGASRVKIGRGPYIWIIPDDALKPTKAQRGFSPGMAPSRIPGFDRIRSFGAQDDVDLVWIFQNERTIGTLARDLGVQATRIVELFELGCRRYLHPEEPCHE